MTPTHTTHPPSDPPHIAHNRRLLNQVLVANKVFSLYPRVSEQVDCLPLDTSKLMPFGYNPSINEQGWLVYRYHRGLPSTKLARAILGKDGSVFSNQELTIAGGIVGEDDPKLFTFQGDQYLSWVESGWSGEVPNYCLVKYAKFNDGKPTDFQHPKHLPENDGSGWCKNLVFFEHSDQLMCMFQCAPTHRIYNLTTGDIYETEAPIYPYGDIRGGTVPIPYEGKLLRFFHSRINHNLGSTPWRYFLGAYIMEPEPPFKVIQVSRKPILYGSEIGNVKKKDCHHWKANVVFVSGAIETKGGWLLSVGENDSASLLCRITPEQLNL